MIHKASDNWFLTLFWQERKQQESFLNCNNLRCRDFFVTTRLIGALMKSSDDKSYLKITKSAELERSVIKEMVKVANLI